MHVAFVQDEQSQRPVAVHFYHTACFFEYGGDVEVCGNDLALQVTAVLACTDTDKVDNGSPMIAQIQEVSLRDAVLSFSKILSQLSANPWYICNAKKASIVQTAEQRFDKTVEPISRRIAFDETMSVPFYEHAFKMPLACDSHWRSLEHVRRRGTCGWRIRNVWSLASEELTVRILRPATRSIASVTTVLALQSYAPSRFGRDTQAVALTPNA